MKDLGTFSGLEILRAMIAGDHPRPPMAITLNFALVAVEKGRATFSGAPTQDHLNPMQQVHGGWYGALLDSAMGCAVQSTLAPGKAYTTLEFKTNITRAIPAGTRVECVGQVQHAGRTTAVANAEIKGIEDGRTYGTGSTTCLIMDLPPAT